MWSGRSSSELSISFSVNFLESVEDFNFFRVGSSSEDDLFDEISIGMSDPFFDLYLNLPDNRFLDGFWIGLGEREMDEDGFLFAECLVFILGKKLEDRDEMWRVRVSVRERSKGSE